MTRLPWSSIRLSILSLLLTFGSSGSAAYSKDGYWLLLWDFLAGASRQTTRVSADVSGLGSTMRITLNDNLLRRGTPEQIQAVVGHEMEH